MQFIPAGDSAITISTDQVYELSAELSAIAPVWVVEIQPAFSSVTVIYDSALVPISADLIFKYVCNWIESIALSSRKKKQKIEARPLIEIPVSYGGSNGPDLLRIAELTKLSIEKIIAIHSSTEYIVAAVGFMPGFGYLTGLPKKLQIPRLSTPRIKVPPGSVAIGGPYTGVYPLASPGGWNIIGRTDLRMFDLKATDHSIFKTGSRVRFTIMDVKG